MAAIQASGCLSGKLSAKGSLAGTVSVPQRGDAYEVYSGGYEAVPLAGKSQTLYTAGKLMSKDVVVEEVPYWETGNGSGGTTAYIAKEG